MSVNKPSHRRALWDPFPIHSSRKAAYAPIAPELARFNTHKEEILDKLRDEYERRPRSEPFDAEKPWRRLTRMAEMYFWGEIIKRETMSPAERFNRLRQLAKALDRTHDLVIRAMHEDEDIGLGIFRAWCAEAKIFPGTNIDAPIRALGDIKNAVEGLATLKTAAYKAAMANVVPPKSGRPALLPSECFHGLGRVYRDSTGMKPGRGAGPFAKFVFEFIRALHPPDFEFEYDSIIDGIKNAHRRHKPSVFDE